MFFSSKKSQIPTADSALAGRDIKISIQNKHFVNGHPIQAPFPEGVEVAVFGMGCFWGAERRFWQMDGVYSTAVGYAAGLTPNPTYEEVCSGMTGHNEVVLVAFDTAKTTYSDVLKTFWESHDPTQGMAQGNDKGTQYRSGIYYHNQQQQELAKKSAKTFQQALSDKNMNTITTEIIAAPEFFYAEEYHQQYLAKNPNGYCGLGGTGVCLGG